MKKLIFIFLVLAQMSVLAQTQDLAKLAKGDYLGFNAVFDQKDDLYGYVALYGYGKSSEKTKKFEYVILDKNLNPVANKEFEGDITAADYFAYMDFKGKIILKPSRFDISGLKEKDLFIPFSMEIDPKTNEIHRKTYLSYDGTAFSEISQPKSLKSEYKEDKEEKKNKGYNYIAYEHEIKEGGLIVSEMYNYGKYVKNNSIIRFDENKKEVWRYNYNTLGDKKNKEFLNIIEKDEKYIYAILEKNVDNDKTFSFVVIDMVTGKEIHRKLFTKLNSRTLDHITELYGNYRNINNQKTFDDKIVMVGRFYNKTENLGFARIVINKTTFEMDETAFLFSSLTSFIPQIGKEGSVEDGFELIPKDLFFLKDGSVGILMEKYRPQGDFSATKTTDLVYLYSDADFKIKGVKFFQKEKTKWIHSDYLFSQYINNGNDVIFFYRDEQKDENTKEKNWNLFINTLIDGKFKQEQIPISSKDNIILPYVAKEGYILLQEFNKKEKYNNIRLERLNY